MKINIIDTNDLIHKHIICHPNYDEKFCNKHRNSKWITIDDLFRWYEENEEDTFDDLLIVLDEKRFFKETLADQPKNKE